MPISPADLIKVLVEIVREKNVAYGDTHVKKFAISGAALFTVAGGLAGAGVGALLVGSFGAAGGAACGLFHSLFLDKKVKDASYFLTAMNKEKKFQLLRRFQSSILILELDACSVETLHEKLKGDKSRTMKILETYFDNVLGMDVNKFAAF